MGMMIDNKGLGTSKIGHLVDSGGELTNSGGGGLSNCQRWSGNSNDNKE
jgi:hypothetical protein